MKKIYVSLIKFDAFIIIIIYIIVKIYSFQI